MQIDVISDVLALESLRDNWDSVYDADPEAQFFLSSVWLFHRLRRLDTPWFVLAARPADTASTYVAFFPLRLRLKTGKGGEFYTEIAMAGAPLADYTGFICIPDYMNGAAAAFAAHIKTLNWADLDLTHILASDERLRAFLRCFPQDAFQMGMIPRVNSDSIDNCICPHIKLPGDWESYLSNALPPNTQQKVRRFLKQVETSREFHITRTRAETVESDIEVLFTLWESKWGTRKGDRLASILKVARVMLLDCFASGSLFLPVLWKGGVPIGALASLVDTKNKSLLFYMGGRLQGLNNPPPGLVLHAYSIRSAIAAGFRTYDFLRGNEAYKYSMGAEERQIKCIIVRSRSECRTSKVDRRTLPLLLQHVSALHQAGRFNEAERGYQEALRIQPDCTVALYRFGQMMIAKGDHREAEKLFKAVIHVEPSACSAWFMLAQSLQAQARLAEAAAAYTEIVRQQPTFPRAYYNLGVVQLKLGQHQDAAVSFAAALDLQPDDAQVKAGLASAVACAELRNAAPSALLSAER
jgi:tetratricopeptide (TPR) repeat protein